MDLSGKKELLEQLLTRLETNDTFKTALEKTVRLAEQAGDYTTAAAAKIELYRMEKGDDALRLKEKEIWLSAAARCSEEGNFLDAAKIYHQLEFYRNAIDAYLNTTEIGTAIELLILTNNPQEAYTVSKKKEYPDGMAYAFAAMGTSLGQTEREVFPFEIGLVFKKLASQPVASSQRFPEQYINLRRALDFLERSGVEERWQHMIECYDALIPMDPNSYQQRSFIIQRHVAMIRTSKDRAAFPSLIEYLESPAGEDRSTPKDPARETLRLLLDAELFEQAIAVHERYALDPNPAIAGAYEKCNKWEKAAGQWKRLGDVVKYVHARYMAQGHDR